MTHIHPHPDGSVLTENPGSILRGNQHFNRLGELRDRTFENQQYRASGLNLVCAAIVLWNTVYIERAAAHLRASGQTIQDDHLRHVAPLGWEHISLTGDYLWNNAILPPDHYRPLRTENPIGNP
jgi:hypothetical protein